MNLALILVSLTAISGAMILTDILFWKNKPKEKSPTKVILEYSYAFFPVLLLVVVIRSFVFEPFRIPSGSMKPSLLVGDFIFVKKYSYGLRLPVLEKKILDNFNYKSKFENRMHACGHDGHTTMLLGAAKYLAEKGNFNGTVYFIFQPDEENTFGARTMIDEGLFTNFEIDEVYAMHNIPNMEVGTFGTRKGAITASENLFEIEIKAKGGHAALPHMGVDAITVGSQVAVALQSIVSRKLNPADNGIVSITEFILHRKVSPPMFLELVSNFNKLLNPELLIYSKSLRFNTILEHFSEILELICSNILFPSSSIINFPLISTHK